MGAGRRNKNSNIKGKSSKWNWSSHRILKMNAGQTWMGKHIGPLNNIWASRIHLRRAFGTDSKGRFYRFFFLFLFLPLCGVCPPFFYLLLHLLPLLLLQTPPSRFILCQDKKHILHGMRWKSNQNRWNFPSSPVLWLSCPPAPVSSASPPPPWSSSSPLSSSWAPPARPLHPAASASSSPAPHSLHHFAAASAAVAYARPPFAPHCLAWLREVRPCWWGHEMPKSLEHTCKHTCSSRQLKLQF